MIMKIRDVCTLKTWAVIQTAKFKWRANVQNWNTICYRLNIIRMCNNSVATIWTLNMYTMVYLYYLYWAMKIIFTCTCRHDIFCAFISVNRKRTVFCFWYNVIVYEHWTKLNFSWSNGNFFLLKLTN